MRRLLLAAVLLVTAAACQPPTPPDGSTAGAPCDSLPTYMGSHDITVNGVTIDRQRVAGSLDIAADQVTVSNSCIEGNGFAIVTIRPGADRTVLAQDTIRRLHSPTRDGTCPPPVTDACRGDMGVYAMAGAGPLGIAASDISDVVQGVNMASDDEAIIANWIHDLSLTDPGDHIDGVISNGGSHRLLIQGNNIDVDHTQTSPIALYEDGYRCGPSATFCPSDGITVRDNWLNGGGYCIYPALMGTNIVIDGNHFGRSHYPACGAAGAHSGFDPNSQGNRWSGNVWPDGTEVA